jgi:hypothetical protein
VIVQPDLLLESHERDIQSRRFFMAFQVPAPPLPIRWVLEHDQFVSLPAPMALLRIFEVMGKRMPFVVPTGVVGDEALDVRDAGGVTNADTACHYIGVLIVMGSSNWSGRSVLRS